MMMIMMIIIMRMMKLLIAYNNKKIQRLFFKGLEISFLNGFPGISDKRIISLQTAPLNMYKSQTNP